MNQRLVLISKPIFLIFVLVWGAVVGAATPPGFNDPVPKIPATLMTARGKKINVLGYAASQHKRNLLLVFFRTGKCGVCVSQLTEFAEHYKKVEEFNAVILAISLDDSIVQSQTSEKISNAFPILMDPDQAVVNAFGVFNPKENLSKPSQFLIGPDQKVLFSYVGEGISDRPPLEKLLSILNHYSGLLPTK
jgi:peroxiredoxin Q/BCP